MMRSVAPALLTCIAVAETPVRVLFVGNSFTYGPPPYDRPDQLQLNNLPRLFKFVAESLGKSVVVEEDTIGGCTIEMHLPSRNPDMCDASVPNATCQLIDNARVSASESCTIRSDIGPLSDEYHPCPQSLLRQQDGPWDFVVLQDNSAVAPVSQARDLMLYPSFKEYARALGLMNEKRPHKTKVAAYMTWAYYNGGSKWIDGVLDNCPGGFKDGCYPFGSLDELSNCHNSDLSYRETYDVACQGYSIARGYAETLYHGADVVVPAGLAWQMARGSPSIPKDCEALIDLEYSDESPLATVELPLQPANPADARWATKESALKLFRDLGPDHDWTNATQYCQDNCTIDHHASIDGMYLNALVFYATLFGESPIGAAVPDGKTIVDGMVLPAVTNADDAAAFQRIAHDTVMTHLDTWWGHGLQAPQVVV